MSNIITCSMNCFSCQRPDCNCSVGIQPQEKVMLLAAFSKDAVQAKSANHYTVKAVSKYCIDCGKKIANKSGLCKKCTVNRRKNNEFVGTRICAECGKQFPTYSDKYAYTLNGKWYCSYHCWRRNGGT